MLGKVMAGDRWTIGKKLYAGSGALLLLTVLAGLVAIWGSSRIKGDLETVTQRSNALQQALLIQTGLYKLESIEKTILWAGLDNDRALYDSSKLAVADQQDALAKAIDSLTAALSDPDDISAARALGENLK